MFHTAARDLVVWTNHSDHLVLRSLQRRGGSPRAALARLHSLVSALQQQLQFVRHEQLGFLSLHPSNLGTALKVKIIVDLPKLANNQKVLHHLCAKYVMSFRF